MSKRGEMEKVIFSQKGEFTSKEMECEYIIRYGKPQTAVENATMRSLVTSLIAKLSRQKYIEPTGTKKMVGNTLYKA